MTIGAARTPARRLRKFGVAMQHHVFQALVDLGYVVAKGLFEQTL
jgi:hypothetical protein